MFLFSLPNMFLIKSKPVTVITFFWKVDDSLVSTKNNVLPQHERTSCFYIIFSNSLLPFPVYLPCEGVLPFIILKQDF